MKRKNLIFLFVLSFFCIKNLYSQEMLTSVQMRESGKGVVFKKELAEKKFSKFKFFSTGQVAWQSFYDTDEFAGALQDAVVFFPLPQNVDTSGLDINNKDQYSMYALNASVKSLFVGPDLWKAKVVGRFEIGFSGVGDNTVRVMSISNAYISFLWKKSEVRFGHYYHPLALSTVYPTPVSGSEGEGYDPVRKAGLIRFTHVVDKFKFIFAVSKLFGREEARWAATPDLFCQMSVRLRKEYHFGIGVNYHVEVPRLFSQTPSAELGLEAEKTYKTTESVNGLAAFIFIRLLPKPFLIKARANYIENGAAFAIMGSYNVAHRNAVTDERIYTPIRAFTFWYDIVYLGSKRVEPAIFIGFAKNLGSKRNIEKSYFDEASGEEKEVSLIGKDDPLPNAQYMFQISPRLRMRAKNFILGFEVGYSRAAFARDSTKDGWKDDYDCHGKIINAKPVSNTRLIFSAIYAF